MMTIRPARERGHAQHGWLNSHHTFSFADYYDPKHMGFRTLRVINEDRVAPAQGFGTHPHRDMEIISYVLEGGIEHKDSMGTGSVIKPGDVQRMSAGTGVVHSEFNPSPADLVHLLQIWILPNARGLAPEYEQRSFADEELSNTWRVIAAPDGRDGAVTIHQDVTVYASRLAPGGKVLHDFRPGRFGWVHVARGAASLNGAAVGAGDGAAISDEREITVTATEPAEVLLFDLA